MEHQATIASLWRNAVSGNREGVAYLHEVDGEWVPVTWAEAARAVDELANGLLALGVQKGDSFALLARTNLEWSLFDFALALVGSQALAQEQTRIYGPDGRSLGTAAPYGTGSVRYRDSRGRTTFTTTTMNGVTRFYDSGGHLTDTVIGSRRR